ncbi:MAG: protein translocase subunit SecD [Verrucomicrobia bacterium]|nr:protein translocase subunit SecD [Verrucomicrobiota bacterium]
MLQRNLWKILLSLVVVAWALATFLPLQDQDFATYAKAQATEKPAEFASLVSKAQARSKANPAISDFVALKQIAKEEHKDITKYFPSLHVEDKIQNLEKRNDLVLNELLLRSKSKFQLGLDIKGGVAVTLEVDERSASKDSVQDRSEKLTKAIEIISARVNSFGVAEPLIRPVGNNRIEVQLPGLDTKTNPEVINAVKKPARLDFRLVHPTLTPGPGVDTPPGYEILALDHEGARGETSSEEVFVKRIPEMTGEMVSDSRAQHDMYGKAEVALQFTKEGKDRFAEVTRTIAESGRASGRLGRLAIVLDGKLYSAPTVREEISGGAAQISGNFSDREALELANVLNNPLDLPLQIKEQYEVGPSLAQDAVDSGVRASVIGAAAVAAFMITFYATGGLVAVASLAINVCIILGIMASLGATMTLPGLAGIVLTMGMAVDANILIFERMREELAQGKSLVSSNNSGFVKALWTILDAHAVQLIICAIMIWQGTGPIKGFGVTLAIGVVSTLFSVLITGHMFMEMLIESGTLKKITMRRLLKDTHWDFIKYGKPAAIASIALVVVSIGYVFTQGSHIYGIDFAGGDVIAIKFKEKLDTAKIRDAAKAAGVGEVNPTYVSPIGGGNETLNVETPEGKADVVFAALQKTYPAAGFERVGVNHIGASIGKEIELNALKSVGLSMLVILFYIALRFEFGFGVGAMASTLHDVLMNIGIFVLFGHQFSAPMVAAILCVVGYSINETVVVFDRIREELKLNPSGSLRDVVNSAINKVFARTIMTATTTFLAALSLFIFGGGVLKDISFTFLVGIVTSTFSAIFIAAQIFYWWHKGDRKHVEAHADVAPKYEWTGSSKASE